MYYTRYAKEKSYYENKKIEYPTPLSTIEDIENDNIDVFVTLEDEMTYTLTVTTPKKLLWYMDKENVNCMPAAQPDIIVRSLTEENIREALEYFSKYDAYDIKLYYLAGEKRGGLNIENFNKLLEVIRKEVDELYEEDED
ncbi:hypothetical protein OW763_13775 [Clostridium aestuarii]|uniref:Uncharacterized protein n=1 Tax=Clostridium aestuarii TaxID=338193 RepID=A0ABT4D2C7_9CLOT|nr:hypothetical protein [Clostridium aestuarii]MCY6485400.1 hypothetical protein [Clostridium aestuarii]